MDSIKMLPCSSCGSKYTQVRYMGGKWQEPSAFDSGYRGECCDCGMMTAAYSTEDEAIIAWNTRAERTCHMEYNEMASGDEIYPTEAYTCSSCGLTTYDGKPNYCPYCGSKVMS